jgi:hypothetical protein
MRRTDRPRRTRGRTRWPARTRSPPAGAQDDRASQQCCGGVSNAGTPPHTHSSGAGAHVRIGSKVLELAVHGRPANKRRKPQIRKPHKVLHHRGGLKRQIASRRQQNRTHTDLHRRTYMYISFCTKAFPLTIETPYLCRMTAQFLYKRNNECRGLAGAGSSHRHNIGTYATFR